MRWMHDTAREWRMSLELYDKSVKFGSIDC